MREIEITKPKKPPMYWVKLGGIVAFIIIAYSVAFTNLDLESAFRWEQASTMLQRLILGPFTDAAAIERIPELFMMMMETVAIAYAGVLAGSILAIPFAFFASRNIAKRGSIGGKGVLNGIRSFPELLFAIIFVSAVGIGPLAGVLAITINSVGMLGKLYSEVIESIDQKPLEALRASGAGKIQVIWYGVLPQVLPEFMSYALYRYEIDLRSATVLGMVGAGGLGAPLIIASRSREWEQVGMMLLIIIVVVTLVDILSRNIRKRIV
ncbi:phosphonate ABC transporter, permease protein PhnE [Geomicrobium sediminis]|uniref:Phosphonate transport system permease protein n=1 Tax=Geomicrobium sediminis TaxID=1347788 RepID=A0ABS2PHW2_9BACL|nr:phosphonate ABC transporter, permease protein PhnE [Geomicrobium sediminis]MBM7635025.1 phosphonate transport system permease protein [Geomicrobium sediminis]